MSKGKGPELGADQVVKVWCAAPDEEMTRERLQSVLQGLCHGGMVNSITPETKRAPKKGRGRLYLANITWSLSVGVLDKRLHVQSEEPGGAIRSYSLHKPTARRPMFSGAPATRIILAPGDEDIDLPGPEGAEGQAAPPRKKAKAASVAEPATPPPMKPRESKAPTPFPKQVPPADDEEADAAPGPDGQEAQTAQAPRKRKAESGEEGRAKSAKGA